MQAPDVIFVNERGRESANQDADPDGRAWAPELWPVSVSDAVWIAASLVAARLLFLLG